VLFWIAKKNKVNQTPKNMNINPDNKSPDQSVKPGTVRMGREVLAKPTTSDPDQDIIRAEQKEKERIRLNEASSLV
jgi:hypothetical protein